MLKRLANAAKTWVVVGVGALVLALSAFFILSNFSPDSTFAHPHTPEQMHPGVGDTVEHIHYDEEEDVPVITLMSEAEPGAGGAVDWDVTGTDGDDFTISSSGVLNFKQMPNYEKPVDGLDANNDGDFEDTTDDNPDVARDNVYQITVRATERMTPGDPNGRALSTETNLIIVVNNVDEDGDVELDLLQPEVGTEITAMLMDEDGPVTGEDAISVTWEWSVSKVTNPNMNTEAHWTVIPQSEDSVDGDGFTPRGVRAAAITPRPSPDPGSAIDEGEFVRAKASYTDGFGAERTAIGVSVHPVRAEVDANNDTGVEDATNDSPGFRQGLNYNRSVPESTLVDMNVGGRITALDPNGDILSYSLMRVGTQMTDPNYDDVDFFDINRMTGQITLAKMLDFEEEDDRTYGATGATAGEYKVIVRATDPSGETGDVAVTITATAANDDPVISGREELSVMEQDSDDRDGDASPDNTYTGLPDMNVNQVSTNGDNPNVYRASDDDARGLISWNLKQSNSDPEAVDYAMFELSSTDLTGDGRPRAIRFKNAPDFEDPGDANRDNVYKVTLVATDGSGQDEHRVSIFVMNVHEQGELTLMASGDDPAQPVIGQPITAMVGDPDGGMAVVTWQWSRSNTKDGDYTPITGATSATYIPQGDRPSGLEDDAGTDGVDESVTSDVGMFLRAVATYLDATSAEDVPTTDAFDERVQTDGSTAKTAVAGDGTDDGGGTEGDVYRVMVTTEKAVRASDADPGTTDPDAPPTPPAFDPGSYTGTVYENSEVGSLVAMSDMVSAGEDQELKLLEADSDDNKYFMIDKHGQIRVGEVPYPDPLPTGVQAPTADEPAMVDPDQDLVPALDHETRTTYRLVISAENDGGKSTANMTIWLMDRNEHPYFDKATREIDLNEMADDGFDGTIEFTEFVAGAAYDRKVTDLAAVEPDGDDLRWEVIGTDAADFETVDAPDGPDGKDRVELRFKENSRPDFESPMDRLLDMNLDGTVDTDDDAAGNNMYRITVRITEASTVGAGVEPKAAELDLTIQVMDGEEKGSVQIDLRQPEVMTPIMASVTDPDLVADANVDGDVGTANVTVTYKWYRAKGSNFNRNITELADDGDNQWEPITGGNAGTATYTPQGAPANDPATNEDENALGTAVDEGRHLLVRATYDSDIPGTDAQGEPDDTPEVVAFGITEYPVRADIHDDTNNSPGFPQGSLTRTVEEDIDVDGAVGNPVQVNLNEDDDVLTYSLVTSGAGADGNSDFVEADLPFFYIDNDTGQIRVKKALNFEGHDEASTPGVVEPSEYKVVVRATDPSGEEGEENRDDITVVIKVTDVNEAPKVTDGFSIIQVYEVNESKESTDGADYYIGLGNVRNTNGTADDTSDDTVDEKANDQNYYKKSDEDPVDSHEWPNNPIPGPDGQWFEYSTAEDGVRLHFIDPPDYEDPNDANGDNVYEVCVTAVDNGNMRGCKMVRIEVMNVQEDGMLMLTPADPVEATTGDGVEITATLMDPDGEVVITDWNWANRGLSGGMFSEATMVGGQTTVTFKGEVGNFVWSEVHYRDGASVVDDPVTALDERNDAMDGGTVEQHKFQNYQRNADGTLLLDGDDNPQLDTNDQSFHNSDEMLEKVTDSAVQAPAGDTTTIDPGDTTTDPIGPPSVINIERTVPENTPSTGYVGIPLKKDEMPGTMTGPDANLFVFAEDEDESNDGYYDAALTTPAIDDDKVGQLALAVTAAGDPITDLDYEASKNSYTIEFSEGQANSDIIRVTILVMDVNEAPSMPMEARGGIHINGPPSINRYNEMRTDMVATYSTTGGEAGATVTWSLDGDDRADFRISNAGELTFRSIPDFEDPMDSNTDNIYSITVEVQDDTTPNPNVDTLFVTVTVGNVDEPGMLTVTSDRPAVDRMITAMLEDDDGIIGSVTWTWSMADELGGTYEAIENADDATYTVREANVGEYLQVKAEYEDGHGRGKSKMMNFMYAVTMSLVFPSDMIDIEVDEDTASGTEIGMPVAASGGQAETVMHAITGGADMAAFTIDAMSGQVSTAAATMLDYETKDEYTFEVTATGTAADQSTETAMTTVTVMVQNVDEEGEVTLTPAVARVDMEITAMLDDPDGGVTGLVWQWESADAVAGPWTPISGAMLPEYTPVTGDTDKYLRAVADYDDAEGSSKTAMKATTSRVGEMPSTGNANADLYDTNPQDGMINGEEALDAVVDYFDENITSEELLDVLVAYFG